MALRISELPKSRALPEVGSCHRTLKEVLQLRLQHRRSQEQLNAQGILPLKKSMLSGALQDLSVYDQHDSLETVKTEDTVKVDVQPRAQPTGVGKINISTAGREEPSGEGLPFARDNGQDAVDAPRATSPLGGQGSGVEMAVPLQRSPCGQNVPGFPTVQLGPPTPAAGNATGAEETRGGQLEPILARPTPGLRAGKSQRHRKVKEVKPKVRKLKYHQYVPPDQKARSLTLPVETAYSQLLQQQQIFLQLQILSQQQHTLSFQPLAPGTSGSPVELISLPNTVAGPVPCVPLSPLGHTCPSSACAGPAKPELLPANLDELTVSELRQQLRTRGLPVSGTKPALLERLRPFQVRGGRPAGQQGRARGTPLESERVARRLSWWLQHQQRPAEGLREELGPARPALTHGGAHPGQAQPPETGSTARGEPPQDECFPELMGGHTPVQMDFPYSPCSLPSFFTRGQSDFEARSHSSSDDRLDTEVSLCDSLGSDGGECSSLETLDFSHFKSFQSLDDELTEAIRNAEHLSQNQSIDDILKEHFMGTESSPSPRCVLSSSPPHPDGDPREPGVTDADPGCPPGSGGRGVYSPLTFDPADLLDAVPDPWPFPGEYLDAPDLNVNRMVNLLVEQW